MSTLKLGISPLTYKIYAGHVLKNGLWGANKIDVTDIAVRCVAEHLLFKEEKLVFEYEGIEYELKVEKVNL